MRHRLALTAALALLVGLVALSPLTAAPPLLPQPADYATDAYSILPPGENGGLSFDRNTNDQAKLYDALTPLRGTVTQADIKRLFKPEPLGLGKEKPRSVERPKAGLRIARDRFGVAHVFGKTQADVAYGAGWVTAADRGLLLALIRGPARIAALDVPGLDPLALALSGKTFVPSALTEAFLANQIDALNQSGPAGRNVVAIVNAYVKGINGYYRAKGIPVEPYTANDVIAAAALIAARFGANGGQEVTNSQFLSALQTALGTDKGGSVFEDLREANDPEAPVTGPGSFPYELPSTPAPGSATIDDGSFVGAPLQQPAFASNALLIGAKRSATGHPLFVAGPQVGYFFPEFFAEMDLEGGGFQTRGAVFPGVPFVVVGRGADFAWSATSSQADIIDVFTETLCGGDQRHYLFRGQCLAMQRFDAGVLRANGQPDQPVAFYETAHGPLLGYATVGGVKVGISAMRSTRGRELLSAQSFYDLDIGKVTSAKTFVAAMSHMEFSFNWFYADDKDIAYYSSGRLPVRAPGTDPALPTIGSGQFEWQGFLRTSEHPQAIDPPSGLLLNWNNKPAADVGAADSNLSYGSIQRVDLLSAKIAKLKKHTLTSVVSAMNESATQDLREVRVWPVIRSVLDSGPEIKATPLAQQSAVLLDQWLAAGASRIDANGDGKADAPGAAIMDAAFPRFADAVLSPVLGQPLVDRLAAQLQSRSDDANDGGSSYISGWYGYIQKDLRTLLGRPVRGPFATRFCGNGDLTACRDALWASLGEAAATIAKTQGADPTQWHADATAERVKFTSGVLPDTMRWTNRPTFQQVITFSGHRPRR
jgi:acyl-homoserine lactone acylase PvdQ